VREGVRRRKRGRCGRVEGVYGVSESLLEVVSAGSGSASELKEVNP
jgi:hypothetical protein